MDPELTNYKCGIDAIWGIGDGSDKGTAYMEEYLYYDKLSCDRKVVYIRDDTQITLSQNSKNVLANSGSFYWVVTGSNGGTIRYKVDRDFQDKFKWANSASARPYFPAYSAPFTLSDLEFEPGVPVVGTTGSNGQPITDKTNYYYRGVVDPFGDEVHTLCVADDEQTVSGGMTAPSKEEFYSSDGRMFVFIVNPKTPAVTVRATGSGQFYTTPLKTYWIPVCYEQTTYIRPDSGTVTFELRDLYGGNVFYRIVEDPDDPVTPYTDAGADNVTLDDGDFSDGTRYLQFYYDSNFIKTRVVVKNPAFPSAGETHPSIWWQDSTEQTNYVARLTRSPYVTMWNRCLANNDTNHHSYWSTNGRQGYRRTLWQTTPSVYYFHPAAAENSHVNALVAHVNGNTYTKSGESKTFAQFGKEMLLGNYLTLDNIGWEVNWSGNPHPTTERSGGGYYVANNVINSVMAYDLLIANYKVTQHADGLTAIDDYFVRDLLASHVYQSMQWQGAYTELEPGMWGTAQDMVSHVIAACMSDYSTPYFGTSGFDGNTTTYPNCPYPDDEYTWKTIFSDRDASLGSYPNVVYRFDIERADLLVSAPGPTYGQWAGPIGYWGRGLMGHMYEWYGNSSQIVDPLSYVVANEAFVLSVNALMDGSNSSNQYFSMAPLLNARWPEPRADGVPEIKSRNIESSEIIDSGLAGFWYDDSDVPPPDVVANPIAVPGSGQVEGSVDVSLLTETSAADIWWTNDGSDPVPSGNGEQFTVPITVDSTQTIKAIAYKTGLTDSSIVSFTYTVLPPGVPSAPTNLVITSP